jgi:hypothetical protein
MRKLGGIVMGLLVPAVTGVVGYVIGNNVQKFQAYKAVEKQSSRIDRFEEDLLDEYTKTNNQLDKLNSMPSPPAGESRTNVNQRVSELSEDMVNFSEVSHNLDRCSTTGHKALQNAVENWSSTSTKELYLIEKNLRSCLHIAVSKGG